MKNAGSSKIIIAIVSSVLITAILVGTGVYIWQKEVAAHPVVNTTSDDGVNALLIELSEELEKPNASIEIIKEKLLDKYGPCWGIPEGQCKE